MKTLIIKTIVFAALSYCCFGLSNPLKSQIHETLEPIHTSDSLDVYQIHGAEIKTLIDSKVTRNTGPDFNVIYFVSAESDSIGVYQGRHPSVPHFCSLATEYRWRELKADYIVKATEKGGHYLQEEESLNSVYDKNDSLIGFVKDTLVWELVVKPERNFWITRPRENHKGQIDIVVELNSERSYFNLFTTSNSSGIMSRLMQIAEKIE
jgi:hypothetical protein